MASGLTTPCTTPSLTVFLLFPESFQLPNCLVSGVFASSPALPYPKLLRSLFLLLPSIPPLLHHIYQRTEHSDHAYLRIEGRKQLSTMAYSDEVATQVRGLVENCER